MSEETGVFKVKIRVVFPYRTRTLPEKDNERINAVGGFNYQPPPTVESASAELLNGSSFEPRTQKEKVQELKDGLRSLADRFEKLLNLARKRSKHISLEYDPELTANESLASAEMDIFGSSSGVITYDMFEKTILFKEKINKYISHLSIENEGRLSNVA